MTEPNFFQSIDMEVDEVEEGMDIETPETRGCRPTIGYIGIDPVVPSPVTGPATLSVGYFGL